MDYACGHCGVQMVEGEGNAFIYKDKETIHFCSEVCEIEYDRVEAADEEGLIVEAAVMTGRVDWQKLRMQKQTLVKLAAKGTQESEDLTGLLHFIDHIQDEAARTLGDEVVFCDYPGQLQRE